MHQVVAQQLFPDLVTYQGGRARTHPRVHRWRASNHVALCWQATPIGGSDCTLSCKLAFRAGKNLPSLCMRTMGGSYACDRGSDGLGPNPPGCIGSSQLLEPKVRVKSR